MCEMMKFLSVYQQAKASRYHLAQSAVTETPRCQPVGAARSLAGTLSCSERLFLAAASKETAMVGTVAPPHRAIEIPFVCSNAKNACLCFYAV